jgi:hypothetical protein
LVKSYLAYDRVESTEAVVKAIDGVKAMDLMDVAQTWLSEDQWSSLVYATQA